MKNKKCENCKHWAETNPPSIGKCTKRNGTTIFSDVCSQFEPNELEVFKDIFGSTLSTKAKK